MKEYFTNVVKTHRTLANLYSPVYTGRQFEKLNNDEGTRAGPND